MEECSGKRIMGFQENMLKHDMESWRL